MKFPAILIALLAPLALSSCMHPDPYVQRGRTTGAVVGGVAGGVIGNNVKGISKWEGAAAGAVLGGLMGDSRAKANRAYYGGGYYGPRRPYYGYYY